MPKPKPKGRMLKKMSFKKLVEKKKEKKVKKVKKPDEPKKIEKLIVEGGGRKLVIF